MTIANNYVPIRQIGNGVLTFVTASWSMLSSTYAVVQLQDAVTGVLTTVTQGAGAGQYQIVITSSGFTVTMGTAWTASQYLLVSRSTPLQQIVPYKTSTGFSGPTEEASFDALTAMQQEAANTFARCISVQIGDTATNLVLPIASARALLLLGFDASGNVTVTAGTPGPAGPSYPYAAAGGTVDAITASFSPAITFVPGATVALKLAGANATTTPTLNGNGTGVKTITKKGGTALAIGDLPGANAVAILTPDTANGRWELLNPASSGGLAAPQGRLCLATNTPVQNADLTAQTIVYYTPFVGNQVPINGGSTTFSQVSVTLDAANTLSGNLYDLFMFNDAGTIRLGYGPAWSSTSARGTGAGTTELQFTNGLWTNKNSITLRYDSTHTVAGIAAGAATYVGTMYATANGQTGIALNPAAASGGSNTFMALWNAYNRVRMTGKSSDSAGIYSYTTNTWRAANASNSNRITFVDGLQQCHLQAAVTTADETASGSVNLGCAVGINLDSTSATPIVSAGGGASSSAYYSLMVPNASFYPVLGLHYIQKMENGGGNAGSFFGGVQANANDALTLTMEM